MKQATLEDTLKRAQQTKQQQQRQQQQQDDHEADTRQQQPQLAGSGTFDDLDDDDFEDVFPASDSVPKQPSAGSGKAAQMPSGRKRKSATAAPTAAAGSGSGARKRKKSSKSAAAEQALQDATEEATEQLDLAALQRNSSSSSGSHSGLLLDLSSKAAWQQLQQDLAVAEAVALGLLLCKRAGQAVQYYSSLQPLSKQQQKMLKKQARACRKVAATATAAAATADDEDDASAAADADLEVVGLAVMPALQQPAAAPASSRSIHSSSSISRHMYYLHLPSQQQQQAQQLPAPVLQLLSGLLQDGGKRPCVCSNAKVVLCCLSGLGLRLPPCQVSTLLDPELLAWMADPQLVQDSKQDSSKPTDCYSVENTLERCSLPVRGPTTAENISYCIASPWHSC
jgi:hypothetical protein